MRLYISVISLAFFIMFFCLSLTLAADDTLDKVSFGSRPAADTPAKIQSPSRPGRPGGGSRLGKGDHRDDGPRGADAIDHQSIFYGTVPTDPRMYGIMRDPNADGKSKSKRRPRRNIYGWGSDCYPYCVGAGLWYDDDDDERGTYQYIEPREPERSFQSGGAFERFEDPRDAPVYDTGYPEDSGGLAGQPSPAQSEIDQYHMMMRAWQ